MSSRLIRLCALLFASLVWGLARADEATPAVASSHPPPFTAEERQWLSEHPVIRVLSDAASPPFDFLDAQGQRRGLYADYLDELSRATGLRFEWSAQTRRDQLVHSASQGAAQLLIGFAVPVPATGFVTVQRAIVQDYPVLVLRRKGGGFASANDDDSQRVSLVRGYAPAQDYANRTAARQYLNSEGFEPALVDVAVGRTDMSVQSLAVAEYLIRQRGLSSLQIAGPYTTGADGGSTQYWSVPSADAPLAGILEKAWDTLPPERHRALRARWLDRPALGAVGADAAPPQHGRQALLYGVPAAIAGLFLGVFFWRWQRRQRARLAAGAASAQGLNTIEQVLEQSPALLFEMEQRSTGLVVRYASYEARRLFAIDLQEDTLPIEAFLRTIFPDDQPRVIAAIQQSAERLLETEQEYRVLSPQGLRWVKSIIRPLPGIDGQRVWSGVTVDISAQKRAEQRVEHTEQRLREIADSVPGVVFQVQRDLAGSYSLNFASATLFTVRGVRQEDFNRDGDAFFKTIVEEDRARVQEALEHSAATLEPFDAEYRVHMADGHLEWLAAYAMPSRARDGLVVWNGYISNSSRLKKAEEELQNAHRFVRDLTDGVPGFIYQMRRDAPAEPYRLTFISAGVSTHGLTAADALADLSRLYEPIDPEDRSRVIAAMDRSYASQSPFRVDYRVRLPTGLTAWMRTQAAPVSNGQGGMRWNGMTFNISEEKLREMQAKRADERLGRLTNALPGVLFQLATTPGGDWLYTYVSDGARGVHQIEPEAVLRDADLLHQMLFAEDWRRLEMALVESVHSGSEVLRECRTRRGDGALRWLRVLARPQGHDGELFVWNGFTQDITEEKEAALAADALQRRLREVTENVPCTVFQMLRDFEDELSVRFVSENIYGLIGITRDDVMQDMASFVNRIAQDDLAVMLDSLDTSHREQRPVFFDFRIRDTSGAVRWLRGSVSTPRVEDGGMVWDGAWLDITDIKELEAELASASRVADGANRLKSEFLATMSHEIRTPMNAIIGLGQLLQNTPLSSAQNGYLSKINAASQSLLGILNDILDHSKIEAGKMSLERTEFDLNTVLDSLSAVIHLKAVEKDLELRFEVPPGLPMRLMGDPLRLGQVLLNLTSNAVKFSERGTVILRVREVSREASDVRLLFEISDEGIGLSQTQIDGLFQSFAQGDASTTRKYGGTGLGLSIARNLIRLMDGEIEVSSQPGQGSVFWFEARMGLPMTPQPHYDLPRDLYGLHALVVDDNHETRAVTEGWLRAFGFVVTGAEGGMAGLEAIQTHEQPFALAVLDWRMPGLNGVETAERIRHLPLASPPALLMATAYVNDELVSQCEIIGLRDFLAKPFSPSALFHSVLTAMGRAEAQGPSETHQPLVGLRVLVADDNEVNLEIASEILEAAGASVRLARDGLEVLDKLNSSVFDVALLDLQMPKLDGLAAARQLRADARYATLPLVAMTAHAMPEHREASRLAGFDAHLLKPIDRRELFDTLLRYRPGAALPLPSDALALGEAPQAPVEHSAVLVFDRAGALLRLGGNQTLLDRLLARFAADHADAAHEIVAAIEAGDLARATREAHTLKGVAANLGAVLLAATAGSVESMLRRGEAVPEPLLTTLRIHQQETLRVIQQDAPAATTADPQRSEESRGVLRELVAQLQSLLVAHDADAKDAYEALQSRLSGPPTPSLLRLRAAVENYEFEAATTALQEVFRDLNLGHDGNR